MHTDPVGARPQRVSEAGPPPVPGEAEALARLAEAGVPLAPMVWVPPAAEEGFYRWNHLPARLVALFDGVASHDPDEDDVEDRAAEARALLTRHVMLDVWVDDLYEATRSLPTRVRVRRPGAPGRIAARGRPTLLALRAIWAEDWSDEAVLARLRATGSVALSEAPVLVHDANEHAPSAATAARIAEAHGDPLDALVDGDGRVTRVGSAARREADEGRG